MFFYKVNDLKTKIQKYEVSYDESKIKVLRKKFIDDCSIIIKREITSTMYPYCNENNKEYRGIRNLGVVRVQEYNDGPDKDVCRYTFDEYCYPDIISLIDRFLNNDASVISEIYEYKTKFDRSYLDEEITKQLKKIEGIALEKVDEKIKGYQELKELINYKTLTKREVKEEMYYEELLKIIKMKELDTYLYSDYLKYQQFFEDDHEVNDYNRILKR